VVERDQQAIAGAELLDQVAQPQPDVGPVVLEDELELEALRAGALPLETQPHPAEIILP
jgi:hypothetical protein